MPNWVYNTITVSGTREKIRDLLAVIARNINVEPKDGESLADLIVNSKEIQLSSFEREAYPETFLKYDTCNHPNGQGLTVGEKEHWDGSGGVITEELVEEYRRATTEQETNYGCVGWYNFNNLHFGCKWDSNVCVEDVRGQSITLTVETPWSLPDPWMSRLSSDFGVEVFDDYQEEFNNFGPGQICYEDGEVTLDEVVTRYYVFENEYFEDERKGALACLRETTGLDIPESVKDSELMGEEWRSKFEEWQKSLPEDDPNKDDCVFYIVNPKN